MNKYLFLVGDLPPAPSANGICAEKIMKRLYEPNEENVHCVLWTDPEVVKEQPYHLHFIRGRDGDLNNLSKLKRLMRRIKGVFSKLFLLPFFPMSSLRIANDFYHKSIEVIEKYGITHVIGVSFPGESLFALKKIKRKYKSKITAIAYPLDVTLEGDRTRFALWNSLAKHFGKRLINSVTKNIDILLALENSRDLYTQSINKKYTNKMVFVGIPMVENVIVPTPIKEKKEISLLYAGYLMLDTYNPIPILDELDKKLMIDNNHLVFNFYGVCDDQLQKILPTRYKNIKFVNHGWINDSDLNKVMVEADAFLNISKTKTNTIPSKVFKYMCLKKPIIHFYYNDNDSCLPYLNTYKHAYLIKFDNIHNCVSEINTSDIKTSVINIDVEKAFPTCTPQYTANVIKNS